VVPRIAASAMDLDVPEAPGQRLTVAATHLENRTKPKVRRQQMGELLKEIHDIPNPVVGGDLNTTGGIRPRQAWKIRSISGTGASISGPRKAFNGPRVLASFIAELKQQGNCPESSIR
jgi:endonuclease/exonuclease/phosphatase (EEP) superfamily protein YafD